MPDYLQRQSEKASWGTDYRGQSIRRQGWVGASSGDRSDQRCCMVRKQGRGQAGRGHAAIPSALQAWGWFEEVRTASLRTNIHPLGWKEKGIKVNM